MFFVETLYYSSSHLLLSVFQISDFLTFGINKLIRQFILAVYVSAASLAFQSSVLFVWPDHFITCKMVKCVFPCCHLSKDKYRIMLHSIFLDSD